MIAKIIRVYQWCFAPITTTPEQWRFYSLLLWLLLFDFVIAVSSVSLFQIQGVELPETVTEETPILSLLFLIEIVLISLFEEGIFRIIPLVLVMKMTKKHSIIFGVAVLSSVVFGWIHGSVYNILIQGFGGMLYSIVFVKYSQNGSRFLQASLVVICLHTVFNGIVGLILLLLGETMF